VSRILRFPDLASKGVTYGADYLAKKEAAGLFPKRRRLPDSRFIFWLEDEIDRWIDDLAKLPPTTEETDENGRVRVERKGGDDAKAT
jgi:predicted DNA-binding transcriptional regulator AlpA